MGLAASDVAISLEAQIVGLTQVTGERGAVVAYEDEIGRPLDPAGSLREIHAYRKWCSEELSVFSDDEAVKERSPRRTEPLITDRRSERSVIVGGRPRAHGEDQERCRDEG